MSQAVAFDTLAFARRLREAGIETKQAEAIVQGFAEAIAEQLATKGDIGELRSDIKALDLQVQARIAEAKAETVRWVIATGFAQAAFVIAILKLFP